LGECTQPELRAAIELLERQAAELDAKIRHLRSKASQLSAAKSAVNRLLRVDEL
jgi:prefoldin subunit 5